MPTGRSRLHITDWFRDRNIRGRVGIRYFGLHDGTEFGQDFYQPALDIRLDGTGVGNPDVNLSVDVRTRRTFRNPPDGGITSEGRMRVYRMYGEWNRRGTGLRAVAGRHYSSALSSISVFDGVTVEYGRGHWSAGGFTGTQPDPEDFGFSTAIREHGAYFTWKSGPSSWSRWQATGGLVGSYEEDTVNREFLVLQGRYFAKDVSASLIQEIDINRGWKQDAGESMLSFTSTFLTGRYQVSERLSVDGGFDTRRSIRLYRDRVTPETEFDDSYRRGYWAGVQHRPLRNTRLGLTVRRSAGGSSGSANSATLTAGSGWPAFHDLSGKIRSTWYRNDHVGGWLRSVSGGFAVGARIHTELTVGDRHETARDELARKTDLFWVSLDLDYRISRPWYLLASLERNQGDLEENTQVFGSALYRF